MPKESLDQWMRTQYKSISVWEEPDYPLARCIEDTCNRMYRKGYRTIAIIPLPDSQAGGAIITTERYSVPDDDDTNVGLQLNLLGDKEDRALRFDLLGTVNSSLDLRTGVRMRFNNSTDSGFTTRWIQDLAYQTGDRGAFTRTQLDFFQTCEMEVA